MTSFYIKVDMPDDYDGSQDDIVLLADVRLGDVVQQVVAYSSLDDLILDTEEGE